MATANYCNQPSDYVSKILTEKRKVRYVSKHSTKQKKTCNIAAFKPFFPSYIIILLRIVVDH